MALIFRRFRARAGCEPAALERLRTAACRAVAAQSGCVVICRTDDPREVIWVGQAPTAAAAGCGDAFTACGPGVSLQFVDGWYRLSAPPYEIWNFELRTAGDPHLQTLKALLALSRGGDASPRLVGRSVFRAVEDPTVFVGFLGLVRGGSRGPEPGLPGFAGQVSRGIAWRPLFLAYTVEAAPGAPVRIGGGGGLTLPVLWTAAGPPRDRRSPSGSAAVGTPPPAGRPGVRGPAGCAPAGAEP